MINKWLRKPVTIIPLVIVCCLVSLAAGRLNGLFNNVDALGGYTLNGTAGTAGYALCTSTGAKFDTACSLAGVVLYYQHIIFNGITQPQEPALGLSTSFTCSDNSGVDTLCDLAGTGTAGTYAYPSSVTTDNKGRVTSITAGGSSLTAACIAYSSTTSAGCTVQADGKIKEWVTGAVANLTGCNVGSPSSAPSPYSGLCSEPYITLSWPVTFANACLDPNVIDNNSVVDPTNGGSGQTFASGSWMIIGTPSTSGIQVQRTFAYSDAGTRALLSSYDGFPRAECVGN